MKRPEKTRIICIANQKGGVGKTTVCMNLAHGLAKKGMRVLAIDNDPQGSLTLCMLPRNEPLTAKTEALYIGQVNTFQVVAQNVWLLGVVPNDPVLESAALQKVGPRNFQSVLMQLAESKTFDYILIDTNPTVSNLTIAALASSHHVLVPTQATKFAVAGLEVLFGELAALIESQHTAARFLGFLVCKRKNTAYQREWHNYIKEKYPKYVFKSYLSELTAFEESTSDRLSIFDYVPDGDTGSQAKASVQMKAAVDEVVKRIESLKTEA